MYLHDQMDRCQIVRFQNREATMHFTDIVQGS